MKHYCYITTNLINGKQYVGDHSTNNLDDNYKGSGILLRKKFKQYGKRNFKKEILEFFDTKEEAFNAQTKYIKIHKTHVSEGGYNINEKGVYNIVGNYSGKSLSEEHKKKISIAKKGKPNPHCGHVISEKTKEKIRAGNLGNTNRLGKPHTDEIKLKISETQKGNSYRVGTKHSKESKQKISDSKKGKIPWNKGIKQSDYKKKGLDI